MMPTIAGYRPSDLPRVFKAHVPLKAMRDWSNRRRFGPAAPLSDEAIFVDPMQITRRYLVAAPHAPAFRRRHSGQVVGGDWDLSLGPLVQNDKCIALRLRFEDGASWEDTGIIEATLAKIAAGEPADGLRTRAEIEARYAKIDRMVAEIRRDGRLRCRSELPSAFRRELGGIFGHVTRDGEVVRHGGGQHRFELARILRLPEIPMHLGVIHPDALAAGHLDRLRQSRYHTG